MKIVGVSMVKDEGDIIKYNIDNLLNNQGFDELLIADNMSSDSTSEILNSFRQVVSVKDEEVAYNQSAKMTNLAKIAFNELGADIVVPFDADEFWTGMYMPLKSVLEDSNFDIINIHLYNYFPSSLDSVNLNPFERIVHRDVNNAPLNKVAIRRMDEFIIHQGNHSASGSDSVGIAHNCMIGHFSWRTFAQFLNKVKNGYAAYEASDLPEDMGSHWRSYGRILYEHGEEALLDHYNTWFVDPEDVSLVRDPVTKYVPTYGTE